MKTTTLLLIAHVMLFIPKNNDAQTTVIFNTPGAGSWTVPCGVNSLTVHVIGGGGGGGGSNSSSLAGGGGGAGGYASWTFVVVPGTSYNYFVGVGGNPGGPGFSGGPGQQSQWDGGTLFAFGGTGGLGENFGGGGSAGGTASGWATNVTGGTGGNGTSTTGGNGGSAGGPYGGAGGLGGGPGVNGYSGLSYGGGGGGGGRRYFGVNPTGGPGAAGAVILEFNLPYTAPNAGADINQCGAIMLSGNAPDPGWTATWTVLSGPAVVTLPNNPNSPVLGLTPGTCSVIRWTFSQAGCPDIFDDLSVCYASVCNDACSGAYPMVVDGPCVAGNNTSATTEGLSPTCFSGTDYSNSVWYSFVATNDSITVVFTAGTLTQGSMAVYSDCPATTEIGCIDNFDELKLTGLIPGNTYYVLVDGNGSATGDFCMSVTQTLENIGASCNRPRRLYVGNDCVKSSGCVGTNQNNYLQGNTTDVGVPWETTSPADWSCPGNDLGQTAYWVWFNSENNTTVNFNDVGPAGSGMDYTVFSGTCAALTQEGCYTVSSGGSAVVPVTANTDYYVLITPPYSNTPPLAYLCITAGNIYTPPNDNCVNATPISSGFNYVLTNSNATVDLDNTLCAGTTENNIWVYWTAEFSGPAFVNLQNQDCIESDGMQMSIFNADANCPTSTSTCILYINPAADNNFFGQFNAVLGQTYYIQLDGYCGTGCSFDFCITEQGGANCNALGFLPVELTSFRGQYIENRVELEWETASEVQNDYFLLERSIDGVGWTTLATIDAAGNTNQTNSYQTYDNDTKVTGIYYYRLSQVDYDGEKEGFVPISVQVSGTDDKTIVNIYNIMGVEVDASYVGVKIYLYSDGTTTKIF